MKQVTVEEAHQLQREGATYVDVRSTQEFAAGHPEGAVNVPLLEPDERGQMTQNPDFVRVMKAAFAADAPLLIGCQAGVRSMKAAQMLESFGFRDITNVRGGFGGSRSPMGGVDAGWATSGLPVESGAPAGRSYETLLEKADRT